MAFILLFKRKREFMEFYHICWKESLPSNASYPCVMVMSDNWNDYGYETFFYITYYDINKEPFELGGVKILDKLNACTREKLEKNFKSLGENYCSLGQSFEYYDLLNELSSSTRAEILFALNDVMENEGIAENFLSDQGFSDSLLRFSEAQKIFEQRNTSVKIDQISFKFRYLLPGVDNEHEVDLDFKKNELPYRINAFVGKNATGKTKILTALAACLSGIEENNNNFDYKGLPFSKVIAISYSAFDELYKPFEEYPQRLIQDDKESHLFSYIYCGLRSSKGLPSKGEIAKKFFVAYKDVKKKNREQKWEKIIKNILNFNSDIDISLLNRVKNIDTEQEDADSILSSILSSGQQILLSTITAVIANIEEQSLLLFDEPEIHLHPNAIANFMRMFYEILNTFDSYAIIATHSPLIIQEVPSRYISVFNRLSNTAIIEKPNTECFGESISNITNEIFEVREHESNYKSYLQKISENKTKEEIIDLFNGDLSFNALTYLNSLYKIKERRG